jgi:hypothetical protein
MQSAIYSFLSYSIEMVNKRITRAMRKWTPICFAVFGQNRTTTATSAGLWKGHAMRNCELTCEGTHSFGTSFKLLTSTKHYMNIIYFYFSS